MTRYKTSVLTSTTLTGKGKLLQKEAIVQKRKLLLSANKELPN